MARQTSRLGYAQLNGMIDVFDNLLAALTRVQQAPRPAEAAAIARGSSRNIAIIGPQGGGKSVLAKAITRLALDSSSVMDNPNFQIRFDDLPFMGSGDAEENVQQYLYWLFNLVYEEGLQTDKTSSGGAAEAGVHKNRLNQANDIENYRLPTIKLIVESVQKKQNIPLHLSMLDLPGELMASEPRFTKEDITTEMLERTATEGRNNGVTLASGLMELAAADLLLIVIPMQLNRGEGFEFKIYLSRLLNLFFHVLRKISEIQIDISLPDIYFCFSKYETVFLNGEENGARSSSVKTKDSAHNALVNFFNSENANKIHQVIENTYNDMKILSDNLGLAMPNISLSCMSSFGFQSGNTPNVRTVLEGDTPTDVLGTSQVGADPQDDLYVGAENFHLLNHWVPFGVEEPILEAASQILFPAGIGTDQNRASRRSFSFAEFFERDAQ